jgi:hypothetical protein
MHSIEHLTSDEWGNHLVAVAFGGYAYPITHVRKHIMVTHGYEGKFTEVGVCREIFKCVQLRECMWFSDGLRGEDG